MPITRKQFRDRLTSWRRDAQLPTRLRKVLSDENKHDNDFARVQAFLRRADDQVAVGPFRRAMDWLVDNLTATDESEQPIIALATQAAIKARLIALRDSATAPDATKTYAKQAILRFREVGMSDEDVNARWTALLTVAAKDTDPVEIQHLITRFKSMDEEPPPR